MGLKSLLRFVSFPIRFLWRHKNTFLPERTTKMEKPTIVKEQPPKTIPDIKSTPVDVPLAENVVQHVKVDFSQTTDRVFYAHNGKILSTLDELSSELTSMDDGTFSHHVNDERNDFANWIGDVFHAGELADELRSARAPQAARAVLERHRL